MTRYTQHVYIIIQHQLFIVPNENQKSEKVHSAKQLLTMNNVYTKLGMSGNCVGIR